MEKLMTVLAYIEATQTPITAIKPYLEKAHTAELRRLFEVTSSYTIHEYIIEIMSARTDDRDAQQSSFLGLLSKTEYFHTQDLLCIAAAKLPTADEMPLILALCAHANSKESYNALEVRLKPLATSALPKLLDHASRWQQELIVVELITRDDWPEYFLKMFTRNLDVSRPKYRLLEAAKMDDRITPKMAYKLMQTRWQKDNSVPDLFHKKLETVPVAKQLEWYKTISNHPGRKTILKALDDHSPPDLEQHLTQLFAVAIEIKEIAEAIGYLGKKASLKTLLGVRQKTQDLDTLNQLQWIFRDRSKELRSLADQP